MEGVNRYILPITVAGAFDETCLQKRLSDVKSLKTPMRGVNLGSWFIAESFMSPELWSANNCDPSSSPGQYLLERCLFDQSPDKMNQTLESHWSTWINETDFAVMAAQGINTVRLPIGWWQIYDTVGGAPNVNPMKVNPSNYAPGALKYIDRAFDWGDTYGIAILLDMHAGAGSQNAQEHSAPSNIGACYWYPYSDNVDQTTTSIGLYTARYHDRSSFLGFALLNEPGCPSGFNTDTLRNYYLSAYTSIRSISTDSLVVISPLTIPLQYGTETEWVNFMSNTSQYTNVYMDLHSYQCFGGVGNTDDERIQNVYDVKAKMVTDYNAVNSRPLMMGEWSLCGVSAGKEWQLANAQLQAWTQAKGGWTYWSWKAAGSVWSMSEAYRQGWFQSNATGLPSCVVNSDPDAISSIYTSPWASSTPTSSAVVIPTMAATPYDSTCTSQRLQSVKNHSAPIRASSLYGWLVADSTLTPSLWTDNGCSTTSQAGELLLYGCLGNLSSFVFLKHWGSFVQESDFQEMSRLGLNSVRIPMGWWSVFDSVGGGNSACPDVGDRNYAVGAHYFLGLAFEWAKKYDLGVILDMHALPGGQNGGQGAATSSTNGNYYFSPYQSNINCMYKSLDAYMASFGNHPNFIGISVVNDPSPGDLDNYKIYYQRAYNIVRNYNDQVFIIIDLPSDQNPTDPYWIDFMTSSYHHDVWYNYQFFACQGQFGSTDDDTIDMVLKLQVGNLSNYNQAERKRPLVVDAFNACGVSFDRTGDIMSVLWKVVNQASAGWIYESWSYNALRQWSMHSMYDYGFITIEETNVTLCGSPSQPIQPVEGCPDCEALTDLYMSAGGPGWLIKRGWSLPIRNSSQYCSFINVACDSQSRVIQIYMADNNMIGTLPASLGNMTHLRTLNLIANLGLTGSIPETITRLVNLVYLDLSLCSFTGTIPMGMRELSQLEYLYLNNNQLSGQLPDFVYNMTKVKIVNLAQNLLRGSHPELTYCMNLVEIYTYGNLLDLPLPDSICYATKLVILQFHTNQIPGKIPQCINQMVLLQTLFGSNNQLNGSFPELNLPRLNTIYLGQNMLTGGFPPVSQCSSLKILSMSYNLFSGPLPQWLGNMTNLVDLSMTNNYFNGSIPYSIANLTNLNFIHLSNNLLSGGVPDSFGNMEQLWELDLSFNLLEGAIPPSIYSRPYISQLILTNNQFNGTLSTFTSASHLNTIMVDSNQFSGNFPRMNAPALSTLYANDNNFTGSDLSWMSSLQNLQLIDLSNNRFSGSLPSLSGLNYLSRLVVKNNSLSGTFPVYSSSQLNYVDCSNNQLSGDTFNLFNNKRALQFVYINDNTFSGYIPPQIGAATLLQVLDATNNYLYGPMPNTFSSLYNLVTLRLGRNSLTGVLPNMNTLYKLQELSIDNNWLSSDMTQLTSLTQLTALDLSNNPLGSRIPAEISTLINLRFLNLSGCGLKNECPQELWNLRSLQSVDLHGNGMTGTISDISSDPSYLDLSGNFFSGSVRWMSKLGSVKEILLQGNNFVGNVPDLSSAKSLVYLNLTRNSLNGTLPALSNLYQLVTVDVSYNNFSGTIPQFADSVQLLDASHNHFTDISTFTLPSSIHDCNMLSNSFECPITSGPRQLCQATCVTSDVTSSAQFSMRIEGSLDTFDQKAYLIALSTVLSTDANRFNILDTRQGSVIIDGEISPPDDKSQSGSASRLVQLMQTSSTKTALSALGINVLSVDSAISSGSQANSNNGVSRGVIIGIVVGGVVLLALLVAAIVTLALKKRRVTQIMQQTIDLENIDLGSAKRSIIDYEEVSDMKEVGSGAFGIVFQGTWRELKVAVKQIRSEHVTREQVESFLKEVAILQNLRSHPNVVLFIGMTIPPQPLTMITEFCEGGSLFDHLRNHEADLPLKMSWIVGIALGMLHLHKENVVHRDLAVRNILLTKHLEPKVTDFGMSRVTEAAEEGGSKTDNNIGPVKWMAPEALKERKYSNKSDVWSFGVVIWEIINVVEPFPDMSPVEAAVEIVAHGRRLDIPDTDANLQMLMRICWSELPEDRPNFAQIVRTLTPSDDDDDDLKKDKDDMEEDPDRYKIFNLNQPQETYSPVPSMPPRNPVRKPETNYSTPFPQE
ncbi:hypothetical protein PROFUN_01643 [Planoprotostelium fungivorum]|uniref:Protein kinase domain-containing protein n=1 Tax=Planoprotostelium fungivorum TaxID=1890364 RepID=A0A2P6NTV1_9EUKA|nr:hypothetical protein PROFUN_01643 [Planoprotostelium fungivorum]